MIFINHEVMRRFVIGLWLTALCYFGLLWFAGVGWVGPVSVFTTWTFAALPLFIITASFAKGWRALGNHVFWLILVIWSVLISANWINPAVEKFLLNRVFPGLVGFWVLTGLYTVFALVVVGVSIRFMNTLKRKSYVPENVSIAGLGG